MKLMFVGDVSLGEHYFSFGHGPRTLLEQNIGIFDSVSPLFESADLVFANLEGPISDRGYDSSDPQSRVFRGSPLSAAALKKAGFDVLNVANNHFIQHGFDAANESVELLIQSGFVVVGLAKSPIVYINVHDVKVAIIGCSFVKDNTYENNAFYYSPNKSDLINKISTAKEAAKYVIVSVHWGVESELSSSDEQEELARLMSRAGANIIVGHHPHTLQPIVLTKESITAYSVGNFVFDLPWCKKNIESGVLEIDLPSDGVISAQFHRCTLMPNGIPLDKKESLLIGDGHNVISEIDLTYKSNMNVLKIIYLIKNILKGATLVKLRFLLWKIIALRK